MADRKISDLTALTTPASGDFLPIVDISEAAAATKNKRITIQSLFQGIPINVGIGTTSPGAKTEIVSSGSESTLILRNAGNTSSTYSELKFTPFTGTTAASASIRATYSTNDTSTLEFRTTTVNAEPVERMRIKSNGIINFSNAPTYADNTAATAAGLAVGDVYKTVLGVLMIRF
jgi:maltoporin